MYVIHAYIYIDIYTHMCIYNDGGPVKLDDARLHVV